MIDVFVDIDGVVNAVSNPPPIELTGWDDTRWNQERVNGYLITWNEDLIESLNEIADRPNVRMVFLTTWQEMARDDLAPVVGLEAASWKVLTPESQHDLYSLHRGWWKLEEIKKELNLASTEKFVWLDDDIKFESNATNWVNKHVLLGNTVAISPKTDRGLTKNHLHAIIEFIDSNS